jgi:hypothetical protein
MGGSFLGWVEGPPVLVSTPVVHWPVIGAVLFVDAKGEPSCLFTVVTRRGLEEQLVHRPSLHEDPGEESW